MQFGRYLRCSDQNWEYGRVHMVLYTFQPYKQLFLRAEYVTTEMVGKGLAYTCSFFRLFFT